MHKHLLEMPFCSGKFGFRSPSEQVLREARLRRERPGAALSASEKAEWRGKALDFIRKRKWEDASTAESQAKQRRASGRIPRLATYDWLACVHNSMKCILGRGLEAAQPATSLAYDDELAPGGTVHPAIVLLSDQEQKQLCGVYYLQRHLKLSVEHIGGPMHRLNNDLTRALILAGAYDACLMFMMVQNLAYGPFQKSGNFALMQEVGLDVVSHCGADDPIFCRLWPLICKDRGWTSASETDRSARERFLSEVLSSRSFSVKGPKGAPSRWCSILTGMRFWLPEFHAKLLGLVFYCLQRGLASSWEQLFQPSLFVPAMPRDVAGQASGQGVGGSRPSRGSTAGISSDKPEAPVSAAAGRSEARDKTQKLLTKATNTVQAVTRMMADPDLHSRVVLIELAMSACHDEYSDFTKHTKGPDSTVAYFARMACGEWAATLRATLDSLQNLDKLGLGGFIVDFSEDMKRPSRCSASLVEAQDTLAGMMFRIVSHILSERALSMMQCSMSYPVLWAGGLHHLEAKQKETLRLIQSHWEAFDAAMKSPLPSVRRLASRCALNTRAMADTARLARRSGWAIDGPLRHRLRQLFDGFGNEKLLEDTLGKVRDSEVRTSCKKTIGLWRAYEVPHSSSMLGTYDRQEIQIDASLPIPTAVGDGQSFFHPPASCNADLDLKGVMENQVWDTFSSMSLRSVSADIFLLAECRSTGCWDRCEEAWHASLIPKHSIVLSRRRQKEVKVYFVLASVGSAILVWPVERIAGEMCRLSTAGASPEWVTVLSVSELQVLPYVVVSPLSCFLSGQVRQSSTGVVFKLGKPEGLLDHLCKRGFAGVAEVYLRKLFSELDIAVPEAASAVDERLSLASALILHLNPDIDEPSLKSALLHWTSENHPNCNSALSEYATADVLEDLCVSGDKKKVVEHARTMESDIEAKKAMVKQVEAVIGQKLSEKSKAKRPRVAKAKDPKPMKEKDINRWWCNARGDGDFIQAHRPPAGSLHVDHDCGRYLLSYGSERKSISWTRRGMADASVDALRWWWDRHTAQTGQPCPWPLLDGTT